MKLTQCLFCRSSKIHFLFSASDRWHEVQGVYDLNRCSDCGLIFLNPQPSPETLAAHYPSSYYSLQGEYPDQARDERVYRESCSPNASPLKKLAYLPFRLIFRTLPGGPGQRVLDVGCGSGQFLAIARRVLGIEAFGVEPYAFNRAFAAENNLQIYNGTLHEAKFPSGFFDVITLNHVFEHVEDPQSTLVELRRILKPGGTLILAVPQSRNLLYWLFGKSWVQLDVPRHMFIPSTGNLKKLVQQEGFTLKRVRYNSPPFSILATLFYWRNDRRGRKAYLHQFTQSQASFRVLLPLTYLLNLLRVADQIEMFLTIE